MGVGLEAGAVGLGDGAVLCEVGRWGKEEEGRRGGGTVFI